MSRLSRLILAAAVSLAACAGDAPPTPDHVVITGNDVSLQSDGLLVPVATHPEVAALEPGDYISGIQGGGYVRTIETIATEGDHYAIKTANASIVDVLGNGNVNSVYRTSENQDDRKGLTIETTLDRTRVFENDHFTVDLGAHVAFQPDLDLRLVLNGGHLDQFIVDAKGELDATLGIDVTASAGDLISADKELFTKQHLFMIMVGTLPVPAVAELVVGAHVDATSDAAITGHVDAGIKAQLSAGVEYALQTWSAFGNATVERYFSPVTVSGQGGIQVTAYAYAELRVRVLDLAGPFVRVEPKLQFFCDIDGNWYRSIGLEADAGAEIELPMVEGAEKRFSAKVYEYAWWQ